MSVAPASHSTGDPFELLLVRAADAERDVGAHPEWDAARITEFRGVRQREAVNELLAALFDFVTGKARFIYPELHEDLSQIVLSGKLRTYAGRVYDGTSKPPEKWPAYVTRMIQRDAYTMRRSRTGGELFGQVIGLHYLVSYDEPDRGNDEEENGRHQRIAADQVPVDIQALDAVEFDSMLRVVRAAIDEVAGWREGDDHDAMTCAFHPGQHCPHTRVGRRPSRCRFRRIVLESLRDGLLGRGSATHLLTERMRPHLAGSKRLRQDRHADQCLDWFSFHLLYPISSGCVRGYLAQGVGARLNGVGGKPQPTATICLIMNGYPMIAIPRDLRDLYEPVHRDGEDS